MVQPLLQVSWIQVSKIAWSHCLRTFLVHITIKRKSTCLGIRGSQCLRTLSMSSANRRKNSKCGMQKILQYESSKSGMSGSHNWHITSIHRMVQDNTSWGEMPGSQFLLCILPYIIITKIDTSSWNIVKWYKDMLWTRHSKYGQSDHPLKSTQESCTSKPKNNQVSKAHNHEDTNKI